MIRLWTFVLSLGLLTSALVPLCEAGKFNRVLDVGHTAPDWKELPGIDGRQYGLAEFEGPVVLLFLGNRCPLTRGYESRLADLLAEFGPRGVRWVAINPAGGEAESLERMQIRAAEAGWTFPYLRDESQQVARNYGTIATPQVFVLDARRRVVYMGAIDDQPDATKVRHRYLRDALTSLLAGKQPEVGETLPRGCRLDFR